MASLYELSGEYAALSEKLADAGFDDQTIFDTLDANGDDLKTKLINVGKAFKNVESDADAIEAAAKKMLDRAEAKRKEAARIKQYMFDCMQLAKIQKVESPWFVVSVKLNPKSLCVVDESLIPAEYFNVIPASKKLDNASLKAALAGQEIPGAKLTQSARIEIK